MSRPLTQQRETTKLDAILSSNFGVLANPVQRKLVAEFCVASIHGLLPAGYKHLESYVKELMPSVVDQADLTLQAVRHEVPAVAEYLLNGTLQKTLPELVLSNTPLSIKFQRAILKRHPGWLSYAPELFTEASCIRGLSTRVKGLERLAKNVAGLSAARRDRFDLVNAWLEQQRDTDRTLISIVMPTPELNA